MDTNEVAPESPWVPPGATQADASQASLSQSSWRGAKLGLRLVSYVAGPIAFVMLTVSLAMAAFGGGSGRGWAVPAMLLRAFGFYFVCGLWGFVVGAAFGLIGALIRRALLGRPIRLAQASPSTVTASAAARSGYPRRRWAWLAGVLALLVLLVLTTAFATGVYLGQTVDRQLADAIAAADRDDPNWRLDDLMAHRDPVPDEENSALVVADALTLVPANWPARPTPLPGEPTPSVAASMSVYDRLVATADNVRLDDELAEELRGELQRYSEAVQIARTVADYSRGRHELELGPTLQDTPLPETTAVRTLARLLAAGAAIRVHDGDPDGALDSCRAILGVGRSIGDEPFTISQLVRVAMGEIAMKSTRRVLGQSEPSDAALARLQALVLDELAQPVLLFGLKGERAVWTELIRRVGAGELPISALSGTDSKLDPNGSRAAIAPWLDLVFVHQRAVALEWMNEAVAIARRPSAERPALWEALQANVDRVKRSRFGLYTEALPLLLMPAAFAAGAADTRYQGALGATAILLAAERHRRKMGDWPASIAAIDRGIQPSAPVDPCSGQPFRMERRDGQLFIYSIGPNRKDEHGAYDPKRWLKAGPDDVGANTWDVPMRRQRPAPDDEPPTRSTPLP